MKVSELTKILLKKGSVKTNKPKQLKEYLSNRCIDVTVENIIKPSKFRQRFTLIN